MNCAQCDAPINNKKNKYCSRACYWQSKNGKPHSHGAKISAALTGVPKAPEHVAKLAAILRGRKRPDMDSSLHFGWKGDQASYSSLHDWVRRRKPCPTVCQQCGEPNRPIKQRNGTVISYLHLANLSGQYRRELHDWSYLCPPCHSQLDRGRHSIRQVFIGPRSAK